jgi:hypothetical protein
MAHFLAVFSPETHAAFSRSDRRVMGFRERHRNATRKVGVGDVLVCYLTGRSAWVGLLAIEGAMYEDSAPRFAETDDPFYLRLPVAPVVWLSVEEAVEIRDDEVWSKLSFTREHDKRGSKWTGSLRTSLAPMKAEDAAVIERALRSRVG